MSIAQRHRLAALLTNQFVSRRTRRAWRRRLSWRIQHFKHASAAQFPIGRPAEHPQMISSTISRRGRGPRGPRACITLGAATVCGTGRCALTPRQQPAPRHRMARWAPAGGDGTCGCLATRARGVRGIAAAPAPARPVARPGPGKCTGSANYPSPHRRLPGPSRAGGKWSKRGPPTRMFFCSEGEGGRKEGLGWSGPGVARESSI